MHLFGYEYFEVVKYKNNLTMHDLRPMYEKTLEIVTSIFKDDVTAQNNFFPSPRQPKMSDLQIIALAITSESTSIHSENLFFSKLNKDYKALFPQLIHRTNYNRRRRKLQSYIEEFTRRLSILLSESETTSIVDSIPCPIVKNSREKSFRICKESPETAPKKGFSAVDKRYYIGYKLHLITSAQGVFRDMQITPANVHDIQFLKNYKPEVHHQGCILIGDKGYISKKVQLDLFTSFQIKLQVPYRSNQSEISNYDFQKARKRRRIETQFSQLSDQFSIKSNFAKTFIGFATRIISKLAGIAVLQYVNLEKGRPINHIKHAWS